MSSETLTTRFNLQFVANLTNTLALETVSANPSISVVNNFSSGTDVNQANQIFADQRQLATLTSESINLMTFNGSLDPVGIAYQSLRVKALIVQNLNGTDSNIITVGMAGSGAWRAFFNGAASSSIYIPGGGALIAVAPGSIGWNLGGASGSNLGIFNASATAVATYNVCVLGSTG